MCGLVYCGGVLRNDGRSLTTTVLFALSSVAACTGYRDKQATLVASNNSNRDTHPYTPCRIDKLYTRGRTMQSCNTQSGNAATTVVASCESSPAVTSPDQPSCAYCTVIITVIGCMMAVSQRIRSPVRVIRYR